MYIVGSVEPWIELTELGVQGAGELVLRGQFSEERSWEKGVCVISLETLAEFQQRRTGQKEHLWGKAVWGQSWDHMRMIQIVHPKVTVGQLNSSWDTKQHTRVSLGIGQSDTKDCPSPTKNRRDSELLIRFPWGQFWRTPWSLHKHWLFIFCYIHARRGLTRDWVCLDSASDSQLDKENSRGSMKWRSPGCSSLPPC